MTKTSECDIDNALKEAEQIARVTLPTNDPETLSKIAAVILAVDAVKGVEQSLTNAFLHLEQSINALRES